MVVRPPQRETASVATQAVAVEEGLWELHELRCRAGLLQAELLRAVEALEAQEGETKAERERATAAAAAAHAAATARIEATGAAADATVAASRCAVRLSQSFGPLRWNKYDFMYMVCISWVPTSTSANPHLLSRSAGPVLLYKIS